MTPWAEVSAPLRLTARPCATVSGSIRAHPDTDWPEVDRRSTECLGERSGPFPWRFGDWSDIDQREPDQVHWFFIAVDEYGQYDFLPLAEQRGEDVNPTFSRCVIAHDVPASGVERGADASGGGCRHIEDGADGGAKVEPQWLSVMEHGGGDVTPT